MEYNVYVKKTEMVTAGLGAKMNRQFQEKINYTQVPANMEKWAALYVRLSCDDDNKGDSNSISHQVEILTKYAETHEISNFKIYKDDGYSGTNFNRPGFQEMLSDIEAGNITTVIVKDMSRFGRNYLEVGMYTEIRFPEMGVRFIAVNDGVDSENESDSDFTPFRNIINEWYAKDTSKKIKAVFRNKGMSGKHLTVNPPLGYIKNEQGEWIIDEETAPTVRLIFQLCTEGNGPGKIARMLEERQIPSPGTIEFQRTGRTKNYYPDTPFHWNANSVAHILERDAYLGQTSNFKTRKVSFKNKKTVFLPRDQWVTFENTHEPIIDSDTWEAVQKIRSQRRRPTKMGDMGLFSGLVFCADCGSKLYHCRCSNYSYEQEHYTCSKYRNRNGCSAHYIRVVVLEHLVLQNLQRVLAYAQEDETAFVRYLMESKKSADSIERERAKRELEKQKRRIAELDSIIQKLYEDTVTGLLSNERFSRMSAIYEQEQKQLEQSVSELSTLVQEAEDQSDNVQRFLKIVRKYTQPTELTPALLREFVDKIIVHAPDKSSGHRVQQIDIHYNFIGEISFSPEYYQTKKGKTA